MVLFEIWFFNDMPLPNSFDVSRKRQWLLGLFFPEQRNVKDSIEALFLVCNYLSTTLYPLLKLSL